MESIPASAPSGDDFGYRALVIDDEKPLAEVVASYLERERFEVTVCHSGTAALRAVRDVDPDVVVLDLGLPGDRWIRGVPSAANIFFRRLRRDVDCPRY